MGTRLQDELGRQLDARDDGYAMAVQQIVAWLRTDDGPTLPEHDLADSIEREFGRNA